MMIAHSSDVETTLATLSENIARLITATASVDPSLLHTRTSSDEWSVNDILAHMRACADMWGNCIATILVEDKPTIKAINPRKWIKSTNYPDLAFTSSFQSFAAQRHDLLALLKPLAPEQWLRTATVTGAGAPLERTVLFYAQWLARHERTHVKQIERMVKVLDK
jgi:uncharacterized damage-inducible protein DinB